MSVAAAAINARPVMILAGGTGGHIFPGIAVAHTLREHDVPVVWLGSAGGMETRIVPAQGIVLETLRIGGLRGKGALTLFAAPVKLVRAVFEALAILRRQRPRSVLSMGGFAAGPGGLAAWLLRRPLIVHEANRAPGFTNRVLARFARRVLCGFPGSFTRDAEVVGNPVRVEVAALPPPAERFAGRDGAMRVLVLGGSQGARALNAAVPTAIAALDDLRIEVRHQCGQAMVAEAEAAYAQAGVAATIEPFIHDMAAAYGWADLLVCRAGAMTLAEVCAAGIGALLVPFPAAVDDHQTRNAEYLVELGAARLLPQSDDLAERLHAALRELLTDRAKLLDMAQAARAAALPDAAAHVAAICMQESLVAEGRA